MPVEYEIYEDNEFLYVGYWGDVRFADIADAYISLQGDPRQVNLRYALNDYRGLSSIQFLFDSRELLAKTVAEDSGQRAKPWRMALVTATTEHFDLARSYAYDFNNSPGGQKTSEQGGGCKAFLDIGEAVDWLGVDTGFLADLPGQERWAGAPIGDPAFGTVAKSS